MGQGASEAQVAEIEDAQVSGLGAWEECGAPRAEREIKEREQVVCVCLCVSRCKNGCVKIEVLPRWRYIQYAAGTWVYTKDYFKIS